MRLYDAIEVLSRRLGLKRGRTAAIANRLQHAGILPMADNRKTPPDISAADMAALLVAILGESGIESAAGRAAEYAAMRSADGYRLAESLEAIVQGRAQPGTMIVKTGGVVATINGAHVIFGHPDDDGFARFATGPTLAAIVAEFGGAQPATADAVAAISRI